MTTHFYGERNRNEEILESGKICLGDWKWSQHLNKATVSKNNRSREVQRGRNRGNMEHLCIS